ncbi:MAG: CRISPR-associated protein Csx16 [Proteobacteria bacterium]|nr:CRISPR-associated protein Csx16 [Pseudomonadota bacterium]
MTTTFASRHPGAVEWAQEQGLLGEGSRIVADYDPETVQPGQIVIGTLPAQLAARFCERGGRYQHLTLDLSPELRGKELDAASMRACNARLEEFFIQRASVMPAGSRKLTHLCIVSDQSLQNLLPTRVAGMVPDRCVLLVSAEMKRKGAKMRLRHALAQSGLKQIDLVDDVAEWSLVADRSDPSAPQTDRPRR